MTRYRRGIPADCPVACSPNHHHSIIFSPTMAEALGHARPHSSRVYVQHLMLHAALACPHCKHVVCRAWQARHTAEQLALEEASPLLLSDASCRGCCASIAPHFPSSTRCAAVVLTTHELPTICSLPRKARCTCGHSPPGRSLGSKARTARFLDRFLGRLLDRPRLGTDARRQVALLALPLQPASHRPFVCLCLGAAFVCAAAMCSFLQRQPPGLERAFGRGSERV